MRDANRRSRQIQDNWMEPLSLISMKYDRAADGGAAKRRRTPVPVGGGLFASAIGAAFA